MPDELPGASSRYTKSWNLLSVGVSRLLNSGFKVSVLKAYLRSLNSTYVEEKWYDQYGDWRKLVWILDSWLCEIRGKTSPSKLLVYQSAKRLFRTSERFRAVSTMVAGCGNIRWDLSSLHKINIVLAEVEASLGKWCAFQDKKRGEGVPLTTCQAR